MEFHDCYQNYVYKDCIVNGKHNIAKKIESLKIGKIKTSETVLDVGCAEGYLSIILADQGIQVTSVDTNTKELAVLAAVKSAYELPIEIVEGKYESIDRKFDIIFCLSMLHLNVDTVTIVKQISKMCQKVYFEVQVFDDEINTREHYQEIQFRRNIFYETPGRIAVSIGIHSFAKLLEMNFETYTHIGRGLSGRQLYFAHN